MNANHNKDTSCFKMDKTVYLYQRESYIHQADSWCGFHQASKLWEIEVSLDSLEGAQLDYQLLTAKIFRKMGKSQNPQKAPTSIQLARYDEICG